MPPAPRPRSRRHKAVTFCGHHPRAARPTRPTRPTLALPPPRPASYYSDPGRDDKPAARKKEQPRSDSTDSDIRYYSEPDAKYFEIDYEFLKELRRIARNNCPKCRRKRSRRNDRGDYKEKSSKDKSKAPRSSRLKENYVYCNGRYHSDKEHCQLCCRICNRSTDTLDSIDDDQYSMVSKSYSQRKTTPRSKSTPRNSRERKNSIQSNKSVSFLESTSNECNDGDESIPEESIPEEPNYTAKSFTNDLKKFLLKPSAPRQSLRDKFITSFKQEFEATKKSPKLKAIKGLWKSY